MIKAINVTRMLQVRTARYSYETTCLLLNECYYQAEQAVGAIGKTIHENILIQN